MVSSLSADTLMSGYLGFSACRTTPLAVIRSRFTVSSPSSTATTTVDDQFVPIADTRALHGVAGHPHHKGAGDVLDQVRVQVYPAIEVVLGR
jgi:hypothetical protein